jgi:ADP-glucose type glycogen/starch synthase
MSFYNGNGHKKPRILIVTPEITYLPDGMGNLSNILRAKAGGLADVSASLVSALFRQGADVHVTLPHYRRMFHVDVGKLISNELRVYLNHLSGSRVHLAEDRIFYYRDSVYSNYSDESLLSALAFQREVINNIIPHVKPDLIHCNDWMTGLVPAMARRMGIPCLFTVHNIHTQKVTLSTIEDRGIDAAEFWSHLYYERIPHSYEESRADNRVDFLASGIFAAHFINTVSPTFLKEVVEARHESIPPQIQRELAAKMRAGCACGILNAPDETHNPETDCHLVRNYGFLDLEAGKAENKAAFQEKTGLNIIPDAPIFFWPSRLDPMQKGCQLLAEIMYHVVNKYDDRHLQIAIVANGSFQQVFRHIAALHDLRGRVVVCDFDESLSHLGSAGADFMLIPSKFEPCGLPQMAGQYYGTLPIVHDTGGLHDTVEHLTPDLESGNGFRFETYDSGGLFWAIDEAMRFYARPAAEKTRVLSRVMRNAKLRFNHDNTAGEYIKIYESMLKRPLLD